MTDLRTTGGECKDDIAKLCSTVPHTKGMLAKCLEQNHDQLSEGCKALSTKARSAAAASAAAPAAAATGAAASAPAGAPAPASAAPAAKPPAPAPDAGKR
jgi:hypothetical protein